MKNNFDFLRLFLAYSVVWHHFLTLTGNSATFIPYDVIDSSTAVRAFFVISGALIWESASNTDSLRGFAIKRFMRVYPAYIIVIVASSIIGLMLFEAEGESVLSYLLWNSVFLNFMHHCIAGVFEANSMCAVNGSLWTLKIEVAFYIFVAICIYGFKRQARRILILGTGLSLVLHIIFVEFEVVSLSVSVINQLPFVFFYFGLGALLYRPYQQLSFKVRLASLVLGSVAYAAFEMAYPLFVVVFVFFVAFSMPFHINLKKVGDISYGAYIFHFPMIQVFLALGVYGMGFYLDLLLSMSMVTLLSFISWRLIEKPALSYSHGGRKFK